MAPSHIKMHHNWGKTNKRTCPKSYHFIFPSAALCFEHKTALLYLQMIIVCIWCFCKIGRYLVFCLQSSHWYSASTLGYPIIVYRQLDCCTNSVVLTKYLFENCLITSGFKASEALCTFSKSSAITTKSFCICANAFSKV